MAAKPEYSPPPAPPEKPACSPNETPGLPGFRNWRQVYFFVLASFVLYVLFLTLFSRAFA